MPKPVQRKTAYWPDITVEVTSSVDLEQVGAELVDRLSPDLLARYLQKLAEAKHPRYAFLGVLAPLILESYKNRIWKVVHELGGPESIIQVAIEQGMLGDAEKVGHHNAEAWKMNGQDFVHYVDAIDILGQIEALFVQLDGKLRDE
jgi:hypothetical protein